MSRPLIYGLKNIKKTTASAGNAHIRRDRANPYPISCAASGEARQMTDLTATGGRRGQPAEMRFLL